MQKEKNQNNYSNKILPTNSFNNKNKSNNISNSENQDYLSNYDSEPNYNSEPNNNYLEEQYQIKNSGIPHYKKKSNLSNSRLSPINSKCSYKCDSSYSINYPNEKLKPLESFGNIDTKYAPF